MFLHAFAYAHCDFQVLLSQVHRLRALDLLGKFVDLGPWAVNLVSYLRSNGFFHTAKALKGGTSVRTELNSIVHEREGRNTLCADC